MDNNKNVFLDKIDLSPIPPGIQECNLQIISVEIFDLDNDDNRHVIVSYSVTNETDQEWDYIESRCQLHNVNGAIIDEISETSEVAIAPAETETFKMLIWVEKLQLLENYPEKVHVTLSFTACAFAQQHIGRFEFPDTPFKLLPLNQTKVKNILTLTSGSISKEDKSYLYEAEDEVTITIKALLQNNTLLFLPVVELICPITDKKGRTIIDYPCRGEIRPAALTTISDRYSANKKRLVDSKVDITLRAYWPVTAGITQKNGAIIASKTQNNNSENE